MDNYCELKDACQPDSNNNYCQQDADQVSIHSIPSICTTPAKSAKSQEILPGRRRDVELAIRVRPFLGYPKKLWEKKATATPYRLPPIDFKAIASQQKRLPPSPPPKWIPRFCLRRIHELLLTDGLDPRVEECLATLWALYKKHATEMFVYENVDLVGNIIYLLSTNYDSNLKIEKEMFGEIIKKLGRGIFMEALSKDEVHLRKLSLFFTVLGLAIVKGRPQAQLSITTVLLLWIEKLVEKMENKSCLRSLPKIKKKKGLGTIVPDALILQALEHSMFTRLLAKCIRDNFDLEIEGYVEILALLKLCCEASPMIWEQLWKLSTLDSVLSRLTISDPFNRILLATADFLHCLFGVRSKGRPRDDNAALFIEKESFQALMSRFTEQLLAKKLKSQTDTRNDTAFLICLVCEYSPSARTYLLEYGALIATIVKNGIIPEEADNSELNFQLDSTPEDLELMQYVIYMLKSLVESGGGESIINDFNMVCVLLMLLLGPCGLPNKEMKKGNNLDSAAWCAIHAIAQFNPSSLLIHHGATSLLAFLKLYGELGQLDQQILHMSVQTLRILLCGSGTSESPPVKVPEEVMDYFIEREGMATFLSVLKQLVEKDNFELIEQATTSNLLLCCSALGSHGLAQKSFFCCLKGVPILVQVLRRLLQNLHYKQQLDSVLRISLSECICACVAYCPVSLEEFITNEGIFVLMDLVEQSSDESSKAHLISCLLQLCDYPRCLYQLLNWNGSVRPCPQRIIFGEGVNSRLNALLYSTDGPKSGDALQEVDAGSTFRNLPSLFCALWKEEEKRLNVLRDPDGCISSLTHPLMSRYARDHEGSVQSGVVKSRLDLSKPSAIRPKVFVLMRSLLEITKTESTFFTSLSRDNQVIMPIILNYNGLKASETFLELIDEMQREGSFVKATNERALAKLLTISRNKVVAIIELQRYFIRRNKEKDASNEHEFYSLIKQCQLQDHLMAASEVENLARTMNYQFLTERRIWQKCELENVAKEFGYNFAKTSRMHRTSDNALNITAWSSRSRFVDSEPKGNREEISLDDYEDNNFGGEEDEEEEEMTGGDVDGEDETSYPEKIKSKMLSSVHLIKSKSAATASMVEVVENGTPEPPEGGVYEISPYILQEALEKLKKSKTKREWINKAADQDQENGWKMRLRWKDNWYPLPKP